MAQGCLRRGLSGKRSLSNITRFHGCVCGPCLNTVWIICVLLSAARKLSYQAVFFLSNSSSGCAQCEMCPGGTEALQTAAKGCTLCRPGHLQICRTPITVIAICYRQCYSS